MADSIIPDKKPDPLNGDRYFMGKGYIMELEKGLFGLFRNVEVESVDKKTGKSFREKIKAIGPISLLREAKADEMQRVVLRTIHPTTYKEIALVEVDQK